MSSLWVEYIGRHCTVEHTDGRQHSMFMDFSIDPKVLKSTTSLFLGKQKTIPSYWPNMRYIIFQTSHRQSNEEGGSWMHFACFQLQLLFRLSHHLLQAPLLHIFHHIPLSEAQHHPWCHYWFSQSHDFAQEWPHRSPKDDPIEEGPVIQRSSGWRAF